MKASLEKLTTEKKPVLLGFYANQKGPCQGVAPLFRKIKGELGRRLRLVRVDVAANEDIVAWFRIWKIPTLVLLLHGREIWRQSGVAPADTLVKKIEAIIT